MTQSMGHQRQQKRPDRNLDDYLIIPVEGGEGGEGDDEGDEPEYDLTDPAVAAAPVRHAVEAVVDA